MFRFPLVSKSFFRQAKPKSLRKSSKGGPPPPPQEMMRTASDRSNASERTTSKRSEHSARGRTSSLRKLTQSKPEPSSSSQRQQQKQQQQQQHQHRRQQNARTASVLFSDPYAEVGCILLALPCLSRVLCLCSGWVSNVMKMCLCMRYSMLAVASMMRLLAIPAAFESCVSVTFCSQPSTNGCSCRTPVPQANQRAVVAF